MRVRAEVWARTGRATDVLLAPGVRHRGCVGMALIHAAALAHILGGAG